MRRHGWLLCLSLLLFILPGVDLLAQEPLSFSAQYSAQYNASANGFAATARRSLTLTANDSYELKNELTAGVSGVVLATLEEASQFHWDGSVLTPLAYSYLLTGIGGDSNTVNFDWATGIALSTDRDENWQIELSAGVIDKLSYQFLLRQQLASTSQSTFDFEIIDGDEIAAQTYRIVGREQLSTSLGTLSSVKLERVRAADDERSTSIWLATEWDFILARLEQVSSSGLTIELDLERASIGSRQVQGLP
ncbi:MAG: DUF3108 domain-containing protein [Gammaproteobacteria bacterium]|jgi:hypothetical protein|nr:hypothetical protein [Gammaproteobacteria bacterium]MDP6094379.1 DUF3108 domain-containing protein [Gammaproteobacteria bacterium]MDP7456146.1 DUF3108 domain-containing protein [Gammaproteobacteria bacterium]|tara:strand:+ start:2171 stop:2920 length:750 start_codon:yes stop_codon:yes gene_type:complete